MVMVSVESVPCRDASQSRLAVTVTEVVYGWMLKPLSPGDAVRSRTHRMVEPAIRRKRGVVPEQMVQTLRVSRRWRSGTGDGPSPDPLHQGYGRHLRDGAEAQTPEHRRERLGQKPSSRRT